MAAFHGDAILLAQLLYHGWRLLRQDGDESHISFAIAQNFNDLVVARLPFTGVARGSPLRHRV